MSLCERMPMLAVGVEGESIVWLLAGLSVGRAGDFPGGRAVGLSRAAETEEATAEHQSDSYKVRIGRCNLAIT